MKQSLDTKIVNGGFSLALLLLCVVGAASYLNIAQLVANRRSVDHTHQVLAALDRTLDGIRDAERGRQGYLLTGSRTDLQIYHAGIDRTEAALTAIEELTLENRTQQQQLEEVNRLIEQRFELLQRSITLRQRNQFDRTGQQTLTSQGIVMDQMILAKLTAMETAEQDLLIQRTQATDSSVQQTQVFVGGGYLFSFSLLLAVYLLLKQEIRHRRTSENEQRQNNQQLESHIQERTTHLQEANQQLEREIAERHQAEQKLKLVLQAARLGSWQLDLTMGMLISSDQCKANFGLPPETELSYQMLFELIHPDDRLRVQELVRQAVENHTDYEAEYRCIWADGKTHWILAFGRPTYSDDGIPLRMDGVTLDITARKQVESALQASEAQLRLALEGAKLGMWDHDLVNHRMEWTERSKAIFGLPSDCQMNYALFLNALHPDDRDRVHQIVLKSIANQTRCDIEYRTVWADGTVRWVAVMGRAFYNEAGKPVRMAGVMIDISDRKYAEALLHESNQRITDILESVTDAFFALDRQWRFTYLNPRAEQLLLRTRHELLGKRIWDEFPETARSMFYWEYHKAVADQVSVAFEDFYPPLNVWLDVRAYPARDGLSVYFQDVTDRKAAEAELRQAKADLEVRVARRTAELLKTVELLQQEVHERQQVEAANQKFISLIESSSDFIGIASLQGHFIYLNEAGQKLVGLEEQEAVKCTRLSDYVMLEDLKEFSTSIVPAVIKQGQWVGEYRFRHFQTGETIPVYYNLFTIKDKRTGQPIALATVTQDIRQRKQAEEALRQSEAKFRSLSECSPVGVFMMDTDGQWVYVNPRCQEICGITADEAMGDGWKQSLHLEDREHGLMARSRAVAEQRGFIIEDRYIHKDGSIRYGRTQTAPIVSLEGDLIGYVGTIEDITESRAIDQIKTEFISIVSHELRTPLTSIRGSLGLLVTGIYNNKPEKAHRMIEIAVADTDRLVRLVNDILDLERLESGKLILTREICDVANLLFQAVEAMQPIACFENITLSVSSIDANIWADRDAIIQTLTNLLSNAIKFSEPGSTVWLWTEYVPFPPSSP
ncbi:MAG: PAS domain S-box protein, partial [Cyanobacteria bacterium CRU_2_1]|nr:PAS domain S-box protein [Cyanobacteria bacterium CRU_2_1]